jgi:hypothetical protein
LAWIWPRRAHALRRAPTKPGGGFTRYFATIPGDIGIAGVTTHRVSRPDVMLQRIIHQGLVGDAFLRHFTTSYDLANRRMIFSFPGNEPRQGGL